MKVVAFPASLAAFDSFSYSLAVAPAIPEVLAIDCSNSEYSLTASPINCPTFIAANAPVIITAAFFAIPAR